MSARDELLSEVIAGLKSGDFAYQGNAEVDANALIDAFAHELAEQQRRLTSRRCVNDTNGDGDCHACARNTEALCRQYSREDQAIRMAADLIDPYINQETTR